MKLRLLIPAAFGAMLISGYNSPGQVQTSEDAYTRYELLDPTSQSFRILYEVTATSPGSRFYFNTLRKGSEHKVNDVVDMATGKKLDWAVVTGADARRSGYTEADPGVDYLKVSLAKPVPQGGEYRLKIDKTYRDPASYFAQGDKITFRRSLGVKRNAIVLPSGYELTGCNYPSQVMVGEDGRLKVSFINTGPDDVNFELNARKLAASPMIIPALVASQEATGTGRDKSKARTSYNFPERAYQTREIVYFLQQPETHSFRLYHDYTETRPGVNHYINVVRAGSKASNPSARNLDTGEPLKVETLKGEAIKERRLEIGEPVGTETEVVLISFDPVQKGESTRLRIEETYTDPDRYLVSSDELIWDRSFGRPFNTVILPEGWYVTANAIPATVTLTDDGKISLNYVNDAPDEIDVFIKARRRN